VEEGREGAGVVFKRRVETPLDRRGKVATTAQGRAEDGPDQIPVLGRQGAELLGAGTLVDKRIERYAMFNNARQDRGGSAAGGKTRRRIGLPAGAG